MSKSERPVAKSNVQAQSPVRLGPSNIPKANPADVASIDAIITAAYDSISGPAGEKRNWDRERSFYEKEISRRTEQFGHIAHVWSTYESRHNADDREPFMRGINSIQLFHDGSRWWIMTIYWQQESLVDPIPAKYVKAG